MKNTKIINFFGGPGSGKSTCAAYVFGKLKLAGVDCELATEFPKDMVWSNNNAALNNQFYMMACNQFRINRLCGKVDFVVTDSPILLGMSYADSPELKALMKAEFFKYDNYNIWVQRPESYSENGRLQTYSESLHIDKDIWINLDGKVDQQIKCDENDLNKLSDTILSLNHENRLLAHAARTGRIHYE